MSAGAPDGFLLQIAEAAFGPDRPERAAVAVSGGSDSVALLHLMARAGWRLDAVTVDHALRPESAGEARFVAGLCAGLGVPHHILRWEHGAVPGNLQDAARRARYRLIGDWARARGLAQVALGHTADDVAETFLMELARGAGIDGLSAMRPEWAAEGVTFRRPFLAIPRADLRGFLRRHGLAWIEDPSNADPRFQRVRARRALEALAPLGIGVDQVSGAAFRLASARAALAVAAGAAALRIGREAAGEAVLDRREFRLLPRETARRLLLGALLWVNSAPYPPRGAEIDRLLSAIGEGRSATLAGVRIRVSEAELRIGREAKAVGPACGTGEIWDGRWRLDGPHARGLELRALGPAGLKHCDGWRETGASRAALIVSPSVWRGDRLVAAPLAGRAEGWKARLVRSFAAAFALH